jgi:hypothetical protein
LPTQGYEYVVGLPATAMPTAGIVPFTFVGATNPTAGSTLVSPGTFSGTMSVDFAAGTANLTAALAFSGFTYNLAGSASFVPGSPKWTAGSMTGSLTGTTPSGFGNCFTSCSASVNGAFFGAGAAYAGYAYQVSGVALVTGTAVFKK